jgi:hypothetical protein
MTPLIQLRSITFVLDSGRNRWITQILSRISSTRLEDVAFKLLSTPGRGVSSNAVYNALEWRSVDAILQRSTFSSLRNVHFLSFFPLVIFDSDSDDSDDSDSAFDGPQSSSARTSVMQRLPQCLARGICGVDQWH